MSRRKKIEESAKNKDKIRKENWDKNMEGASKAWDGLIDMLTPKKKKKPGKVKLNKEKVRKFKQGL